jgi:hypothetical protein
MSGLRNDRGKYILERIASRVMTERGFLVDFSQTALVLQRNIYPVDILSELLDKIHKSA